jgi:thioredoxin reductase (NADPH)
MRDAPFPILTDAQLDRLRAAGMEREVAEGDELFDEGERGYDFFAVLDGAVGVYADEESNEPLGEALRAGQFLGEVGLLLGETVFATARVLEGGRVLQVPAGDFRHLMATDTGLADVILGAFIARREIVARGASGLTLLGSRTAPAAVRLAEFCRRNYLPMRWVDLEGDADEARAILHRYGCTSEQCEDGRPIVLWGSETVLLDPTNLDVARAVGIATEPPDDGVADLLVVGAGPAGLAAAVYGASEGLQTVVIDEVGAGGQAGASSRIENYLGFPSGISGTELATRALVQARKFGAALVTPRRVISLDKGDRHFVVGLEDGPDVRAHAVIVATGAHWRRLPVDRLRQYEGAGVYYAATEAEARVCTGATVCVVGAGNSAGQAAMFLSERAEKVLLLVRGGDLRKSMSAYLVDRVEGCGTIEIRTHTEVKALHGDDDLDAVDLVCHPPDGEEACETVQTPGLFCFIGADPCTGWLGDVALDRKGFVLTGRDVPKDSLDPNLWGDDRPTSFETSLPGLYAVGDARSGSTKRVAGAVGEGSVVVKDVHAHLAAHTQPITEADDASDDDSPPPPDPMTPDVSPAGVQHNEAEHRYELALGDQKAIASYEPSANALVFVHTEVPDGHQGEGVGTALITGALDDVRASGGRVIPQCPFVAAFIRDHEEYAGLVAD